MIRPGAIGDCILSFPALKFLSDEYTEVWISSSVVPLVQFADRVRAISSTQLDLVFGGNFPNGLRETLSTFDRIVSWYGANRPEFRQALRSVHADCTFLDALPGDDTKLHAVDFYLQQVGGPPGGIPRIDLRGTAARSSLLIHPFSGGARKNWPLTRFRELAARSALAIEWTAGPEEELEGAAKFDNLLKLAEWMKGASVYLGNDSGISHLAAAIGLPSVVLFGETNPAIWAPRGPLVKILQYRPLSDLAVEPVLETLVSG